MAIREIYIYIYAYGFDMFVYEQYIIGNAISQLIIPCGNAWDAVYIEAAAMCSASEVEM